MPDPKRLAVDGSRLTGRARAAYDAGRKSGPQRNFDDTPEAAREQVRAHQRRVRADMFLRSVPARYVKASYDQLDDTEQAGQQVRGWLASPSQTLFLTGEPGRGKTHAAYAVLHAALAGGQWVAGCSVVDLLDLLRPGAPASAIVRIVEQADVVLFDDLGAERATDWVIEQFRQIIDARTREGRRQVVTTNLSYAEVETQVTRPVMSRLMGGATTVQFGGRDRRRDW